MFRAASVSSGGCLLVPRILYSPTTGSVDGDRLLGYNIIWKLLMAFFVKKNFDAAGSPCWRCGACLGWTGHSIHARVRGVCVCVRAAAVPGTLAAARRARARLVCPCFLLRVPCPRAGASMPARRHMRAWFRSLHRRPPPVCLCQLAPGVVPDSLGAVSASANSLLRRCSNWGTAQSSRPSHRIRQADSLCIVESPSSSPHGPACRDLLHTVSPPYAFSKVL